MVREVPEYSGHYHNGRRQAANYAFWPEIFIPRRPMSRKTTRNGAYHYCCRNRFCRHVKASKDALDTEFLSFLAQREPRPELVRLFRKVVLDVWNRKQESDLAQQGAIDRRIEEIKARINQLEDAFIFRKVIDEETYNRQRDTLRQQRLLAEMERRDAEWEDYDVEAMLQFAEHLLKNAAEMWQETNLEQRQQLQSVIFPKGVTLEPKQRALFSTF